jgi:hypothetical protein
MFYGRYQQTVIFPRITTYDGSITKRTCSVGTDEFAIERILQIHQLGFVKFKIAHIYKKNNNALIIRGEYKID